MDETTTERADALSTEPVRLTDDLHYLRDRIVNLYLFGPRDAGDQEWVLVDTGMQGGTDRIVEAARSLFGEARPAAIVLTHGHFDHVGAMSELARRWNVPVYAHELELPYITGRSAYPPADPTVGGGAMARLARLYPRGPFYVEGARTLPADGAVPGMPGWRWIHTPGHAPGHVSLWRESDRSLIAGDAFVTTKQESALSVLSQRREIHGPPAYYTPDWERAAASVRQLAALEPELGATGHGVPMRGEPLRRGLHRLADHFERDAVPKHGRYVGRPAVMDERGVVSVPPPVHDRFPIVAAGAAAAAVGVMAYALKRGRERRF